MMTFRPEWSAGQTGSSGRLGSSAQDILTDLQAVRFKIIFACFKMVGLNQNNIFRPGGNGGTTDSNQFSAAKRISGQSSKHSALVNYYFKKIEYITIVNYL